MTAAIFEDLYKRVRAEGLTHVLGEEDGLLVGVVVTHEAADESDENDGRILGMRGDRGFTGQSNRCDRKGCEQQGRQRDSREPGHAETYPSNR